MDRSMITSSACSLFAASVVVWTYCCRKQRLSKSTATSSLRNGGKLAVVTRIHGNKSLDKALQGSLLHFLSSMSSQCDAIVVCIGADTLESLATYTVQFKDLVNSCNNKVTILPIYPWGRFVTALNAGIREVMNLSGFRKILFQSLEFATKEIVVKEMIQKLDEDAAVLVVGPAMNGHIFCEGQEALSGRSCPWNTCAMWDLEKLHLLGFPFIGDGLLDGGSETGGVEVIEYIYVIIPTNNSLLEFLCRLQEVSTIAILQAIKPQWKALLLNFPPDVSTWNVSFADSERQLYHEKKMESKIQRPRAHLDALGLRGVVHHISILK